MTASERKTVSGEKKGEKSVKNVKLFKVNYWTNLTNLTVEQLLSKINFDKAVWKC